MPASGTIVDSSNLVPVIRLPTWNLHCRRVLTLDAGLDAVNQASPSHGTVSGVVIRFRPGVRSNLGKVVGLAIFKQRGRERRRESPTKHTPLAATIVNAGSRDNRSRRCILLTNTALTTELIELAITQRDGLGSFQNNAAAAIDCPSRSAAMVLFVSIAFARMRKREPLQGDVLRPAESFACQTNSIR